MYKLGYPILKLYWFIFRPKTKGVKCLIISGDEILLVRHAYGNPTWALSGGGVKKNESNEEAIKREIKEELGLYIEPKYIGEFTHTTEYKLDTVYCFVAKIEKIAPKIDNAEIMEAKWWKINSLPEHSTGLDKVLSMYKQKGLKIRNKF